MYKILSKANIRGSIDQPPPFLTKYDVSVLPIIIFAVRAQYKKDLLGQVQRRYTKMISGVEHLSYKKSMRELV